MNCDICDPEPAKPRLNWQTSPRLMPFVGNIKFKRAPFLCHRPFNSCQAASETHSQPPHCFLPFVSSFASPTGSGNLATYVPSTSLKSKIFLMSSTCFFQDPSPDSPFSFAISHRGWRSCRREGRRDGAGGGGGGISCLTQTEEGKRNTEKCTCVFLQRLPGCVRVSASSAPRRQQGEPDRSAGGSSYPESLFD